MASAAPTASSTKETTNYARLCRLLVGLGSQALRETFDAIHAPGNLHTILGTNKPTLQSLRAKKIINPIQWGKLFPAIPTSVSSRDFDTTLLVVLLRNLCGLTAPLTGWDALPAIADLSKEADIARVKHFRNTVYGHAEKASVDDVKFNDYWRDIRDTLVRLGGVTYEAAIDDLRNECMDPEVGDHFMELLSQWKKDENNIKDQLDEIKKRLDVLTASKETTDQGETSTSGEVLSRRAMCKYHESEEVEHYCLKCKVCICQNCQQVRHRRHSRVKIQQAADERKAPMARILYDAKAEIVVVESKINKQIELRTKSKARMTAAVNKVNETVEELVQVLRDQEKLMKEKLTQIYHSQEKDHEAQLEKFQMFAREMKRSVERGEGIFQRNVALEILEEEHSIFSPCKELLDQCQKLELYKPEDVNYVVNKENVSALRQLFQLPLGEVIEHDHSQSKTEGEGLKEAEQGLGTNFTITTRDLEGKQFYSELEEVTVTIKSPDGEEETQVEDCKDGTYNVHYIPKSVGQHDVRIEVNGWPLTGSPWKVNVKPHKYQVVNSHGTRGQGEGEFDFPWNIAKNDNTGDIAVADFRNKRVHLFDAEWKYLRTIGGVTGSQTGAAVKMGRPWSVAFSRNGDMILIHGDKNSRKMSVLTNGGQFIEQFSEHVIDPRSVFIKTDGESHVIVCDSADHKIKVLSPDGAELLQSFGAPDCDACPSCVVYHQETYFVSYMMANCVTVFNREGIPLFHIGSQGEVQYPSGLAVDAFDNLIICGDNKLHMFTLDGKFLASFDQEIQRPWAMTVCKNGDLLVTDLTKHNVLVFR